MVVATLLDIYKIMAMLRSKFFIGIVIFSGILFSCGSSNRISDKKDKSQQLDALVSSQYFEILSDRALPMATASLNSISNAGLLPPGSSAGQISLIGNSNYLKVIGDSIAVYLPYYGERQMGGGYNNNGPGIQFKGIPKEMDITKDSEKQRYSIRFEMKVESETFNVNVMLFPNLSSIINVNSSQRFPIRYSGTVKPIPNED